MAIQRFPMILALVTSLLILGACGKGNDSDSPYDPEQVIAAMSHLDQQADVIWGNSGSEWDADGERELFPTTDEGWSELEAAANELILISQSLGKLVNDKDPRAGAWHDYTAGVAEVSQKLALAAAQHDKKEIFDQGGVLYQVCTACHGTFPAANEENRP